MLKWLPNPLVFIPERIASKMEKYWNCWCLLQNRWENCDPLSPQYSSAALNPWLAELNSQFRTSWFQPQSYNQIKCQYSPRSSHSIIFQTDARQLFPDASRIVLSEQYSLFSRQTLVLTKVRRHSLLGIPIVKLYIQPESLGLLFGGGVFLVVFDLFRRSELVTLNIVYSWRKEYFCSYQ